MAQTLTRNEPGIAYPNGFSQMSPEELPQARNNPYPYIWGICNEEAT